MAALSAGLDDVNPDVLDLHETFGLGPVQSGSSDVKDAPTTTHATPTIEDCPDTLDFIDSVNLSNPHSRSIPVQQSAPIISTQPPELVLPKAETLFESCAYGTLTNPCLDDEKKFEAKLPAKSDGKPGLATLVPDWSDRIKATKNQQYPVVDLVEAAQHILYDGWSYQQCVLHYGWTLPQSTIHAEVKRQETGQPHKQPGKPRILEPEQERWLAAWVRFCALLGAPVRKYVVLLKAKSIAAAIGKKFGTRTGLPSKKWWTRFSDEHELKLLVPNFRTKAAHMALTRETLDQFYTLLFDIIQRYDIPPELIWAVDETGFNRTEGRASVVTGQEIVKQTLVGTEFSQHITLMSIGSAAGFTMDPFLLLKGQGERILSNPIKGLPEHSAVVYTPKAWSNEQSFFLFIRWFAWRLDTMYPQLRESGKYALLLVDGHSSRMNAEMLEWAAQHRIILLCYPPNCTSKLQPADVSLHGPLKSKAYELVTILRAQKVTLTKDVFIQQVIYPAWQHTYTKGNIQAGYRKTGIWPRDRLAIADSELRQGGPGTEDLKSLESFVEQKRATANDALIKLMPTKPLDAYLKDVLEEEKLEITTKPSKKSGKAGKGGARILSKALLEQLADEAKQRKEERERKKRGDKPPRVKAKAKAKAKSKAKSKAKGKSKSQPKPSASSSSNNESKTQPASSAPQQRTLVKPKRNKLAKQKQQQGQQAMDLSDNTTQVQQGAGPGVSQANTANPGTQSSTAVNNAGLNASNSNSSNTSTTVSTSSQVPVSDASSSAAPTQPNMTGKKRKSRSNTDDDDEDDDDEEDSGASDCEDALFAELKAGQQDVSGATLSAELKYASPSGREKLIDLCKLCGRIPLQGHGTRCHGCAQLFCVGHAPGRSKKDFDARKVICRGCTRLVGVRNPQDGKNSKKQKVSATYEPDG